MNRLFAAFAALMLIVVIGCGGGGGGGGSTTDGTTGAVVTEFSGRVIDVATGIPITPGAAVTIGGATQTSDPDSGIFSIDALRSATQANVVTAAYGTWNFPFVAATSATLDLGDLYVGPERVTVTGTALDATTNAPISGARVEFGGRSATANASGVFSITGVAYSSAAPSAFSGIVGRATASGYVPASFDANLITPSGGVFQVGDVRLFSSGDTTPPDGPYNLTGLVKNKPSGSSITVELLQGDTVIRTAPSRTDDRYFFWVEPGDYTLHVTAGTKDVRRAVTLTTTNTIVTRDIDLE